MEILEEKEAQVARLQNEVGEHGSAHKAPRCPILSHLLCQAPSSMNL